MAKTQKDIYRVVDRSTGNVVASGFAARSKARIDRDKANENAKADCVICRGKDHPKGSTDGVDRSPPKKYYI